MRLEAPLNSENTYRKPLPARHSQRYFGGGGYDADRQDSGQVGRCELTRFTDCPPATPQVDPAIALHVD
jgi:hypothetical protein